MRPRNPTEEEREWWSQMDGTVECKIGPMMGRHLGAEDITVIHHRLRGGSYYVRVPWVVDERDVITGLREGLTVWQASLGGMMASDMVLI